MTTKAGERRRKVAAMTEQEILEMQIRWAEDDIRDAQINMDEAKVKLAHLQKDLDDFRQRRKGDDQGMAE